jgi:hypothetical protein
VVTITVPVGPGVYDWTAQEYHADPLAGAGGSVSSTVLRHILWPAGSPARVLWERAHPVHKDVFDFGSVAHRLILGKGEQIEVVDAPDWRGKAAQTARDDARAAGLVPILAKDLGRAGQLAHAVLAHADAGPLFEDGRGVSERSVVWTDDITGRWCRAMLDRFPHLDGPGRPIAVDVKTTSSVATRALIRTIVDHGYDQQAAWYLDGLASLGMVDAVFVFVFAETQPPHHVRVVTLSQDWVARGRARNRDALDLYDRCADLDDWPGAPPGLLHLEPPRWFDTDRADDIDL